MERNKFINMCLSEDLNLLLLWFFTSRYRACCKDNKDELANLIWLGEQQKQKIYFIRLYICRDFWYIIWNFWSITWKKWKLTPSIYKISSLINIYYMLDISSKKAGHFFMIHKSRCELIWMMGLYLECVDVKELWVLKMKKNVPYELSLLIVKKR